jgi:DNA-binding transcriptional ArsR family regulator
MSADLEALFSSTARVEVLRLLLLNPGSQFYQRQIERETGQPIRAVQREVKRLTEVGLLGRTTEGNRVFYSLNPDYPLLAELTALFQKASGEEGAALVTGDPTPPEPSSIRQPFPWMETLPVQPLPEALRELQVEGEWDQAF